MKTPCELIVWYVLPTIRRDLARELVDNQGLRQSEVARIFGVTDAAVSQYLHSHRGINGEMQRSERYKEFKAEVGRAAKRIRDGSDYVTEACRLCTMIKQNGMLDKIYSTYTGVKAPPCICSKCPI